MLRLSACLLFQRSDGKILFVQRKESDLWGLPGGKLEPHEQHYIHFFCMSHFLGFKQPTIETGTISDPISFLMQDPVTLAGFLHAAIRESEEECGLMPTNQKINSPLPIEVYSVLPLYCAAIKDPISKKKEFFTVTFYCSQFEGSEFSSEGLKLSWEEPEFLLSSQVFVPEYNSKIFPLLPQKKDKVC